MVPDVAQAARDDACPVGVSLRADKTAIKALSEPILFTVTVTRTFPAGGYCSSNDEIKAHIRILDPSSSIRTIIAADNINFQIPTNPTGSGRNDTMQKTVSVTLSNVSGVDSSQTQFDFQAVIDGVRRLGNATGTPIYDISNEAVQVNVTESGSGNPCILRLFFRHQENGSNVDQGTISGVSVGETKYKVIGKVDGAGCDTNYWIRMTASDENGNFSAGTALSPQHPVVGREYSVTPNFAKAGRYIFYLDYAKDRNFSQFKQNNSVTALVGTVTPGPGPGTGPGNNTPPVNTQYTIGKVDYDASFGSLDSLITPKSIPDFIAAVLKLFFLGIAGWAIVMILVGAFRMVMSRGNTEAITAGKKTLTWAIIGFVVALMSYSIVAILQTALGVQ